MTTTPCATHLSRYILLVLSALAAAAAVPPHAAFVLPVGAPPRAGGGGCVLRPGRLRRFEPPSSRIGSAAAAVAAAAATAHLHRGSDDPALTILDPSTNVTVVLVGCLHGSGSSSDDVLRALGASASSPPEDDGDVQNQAANGAPRTDAVVLELCAARFADVRNEMRARRAPSSPSSSSSPTDDSSLRDEELSDYLDGSESGFSGLRGWASGVPRFLSAVRRTAEKRGTAAAAAALALGTVSGAQAALSGFEPGREFAVATECAVGGRGGCVEHETDVILADKTVDETLRRVGSLPAVSGGMMRTFLTTGGDWNHPDAYGPEARALSTAIRGDPDLLCREGPPQQVDMARVLTRNAAVRSDLLRLTAPPLILAEGLASAVNGGLDALTGGGAAPDEAAVGAAALADLSSTLTASDVLGLSLGVLADSLLSAAVLVLGYVALVLPAVKLILSERDDALANGVRAACRVAAAKTRDRRRVGSGGGEEDGRGRVVAVLGLLHVNGVARRLLMEESIGSTGD